MPSYACGTYRRKTIDVQRLVQDYETLLLLKVKKGRTALDHLTRSGVVLLSGAWESYIEDVILEVAVHFATLDSPDNLPKEVKKTINHYIKNHKEDNKPLSLAGDGWKRIYLDEIVTPNVEALNTPKISNIDELSKRLIGVEEVSKSLSTDNKKFVNDFISYRGHIAHRVRIKGEAYLTSDELSNYIIMFHSIVNDVDNYLLEYVKKYKKSRPWNKAT